MQDRDKISAVANFFLEKGGDEHIPITLMKLLKLVYIGYAWHYWNTGKKLFEEPIEAWQHGPVVPSLYHEFKHYGQKPIDGLSMEIEFLDNKDREYDIKAKAPTEITNENEKAALMFVWNTYKEYSSWQLRNMTHLDNTPWHKAYERGALNTPIQDSNIKEYYDELAKKSSHELLPGAQKMFKREMILKPPPSPNFSDEARVRV